MTCLRSLSWQGTEPALEAGSARCKARVYPVSKSALGIPAATYFLWRVAWQRAALLQGTGSACAPGGLPITELSAEAHLVLLPWAVGRARVSPPLQPASHPPALLTNEQTGVMARWQPRVPFPSPRGWM